MNNRRLNQFRQRLPSTDESMDNPNKWSVYNRSSFAANKKIITPPLKKSTDYTFKAKAGVITNPILPFNSPPSPEKKSDTKSLFYDNYLVYRQLYCKKIIDKLKGGDIKLNADNQYPCILLATPMPPVLADMKHHPESSRPSALKTAEKCWTKLVTCYFVAITNHLAFSQGIPIEIVFASGFGGLLPSVSECHTSIRINLGLVPNTYVQILVKAIKQLYGVFNKDFMEIMKTTTISTLYIQAQNQYAPNKQIELMNIWDWLWSKADKSSKSVIYQFQRKHKVLEALTDYIFRQLSSKSPLSVKQKIQPLVELSKLFEVIDGRITVLAETHAHSKNWFAFPTHTHYVKKPYATINDKVFWKMLTKLVGLLGGDHTFIEKKQLFGLYAFLDKTHKKFLKDAISAKSLQREPASDSECETDEQTPWYGKKVIVANGMRAINTARRAVEHYIGAPISHKNIDTRASYYETAKAMKLVLSSTPLPKQTAPRITPEIIIFDLNHANTAQTTPITFPKKDYTAIILDYTSATTEKIRQYIYKCKEYTKLILLVSSGTKNEQAGADLNAYGTLRILTPNKNECKRLYNTLIKTEDAIHYNTSHQARRAYKAQAMLPSFKNLIKNTDTNATTEFNRVIAKVKGNAPSDSNNEPHTDADSLNPKP